uniref:Carboxyl-terminal-processing peptidase 2ic isoform X4 n=2 Tax=Rhizophora mucronata TaxID=61149 RepID=A0A2P2LYW8_RHIMU
MEMLASSATLYPSHHFTVSNTGRYACRSTLFSINPQVQQFKCLSVTVIKAQLRSPLMWIRIQLNSRKRNCSYGASGDELFFHPLQMRDKSLSSQYGFWSISYTCNLKLRRYVGRPQTLMNCSEKMERRTLSLFVQLVAAFMLVASLSAVVSRDTSCEFKSM